MAISLLPRLVHDVVDVNGVRVFYRAAGPVDAPTLLLLHGFPSASHQYRRLMYSFDTLTDVIDGFVGQLGLSRFALYAFDFGGPVGLRLAGAADRAGELLTLPVTGGQYENGVRDLRLVVPDGWTLDQHFRDLPGRDRAQIELTLDYHSNVERYPQWRQYLREHQPPTLILWGRNDAFFTGAGAHAYQRDVRGAQLHPFDTGHFSLEDHLDEIAPRIASFLELVAA